MLELKELKEKYIEYSEEITEDIFNKILDRAKEFAKKICPNLRTYGSFDDDSFDSFRSNKFFRFSGKDYSYSYGVDNNRQSAKEIKVSDILGEETKFEVGKWYSFYWNWSSGYTHVGKVGRIYTCGNRTTIYFNYSVSISLSSDLNTKEKPIDLAEIENIKELTLEEIQQYLPDSHPDKIVKEFVLPRKWCIKFDKDNWKILANWANFDWYSDYKNDCTRYLTVNKTHFSKLGNEFTEITFDQFKQYVLKEDLSKYDSEGNLIEVKEYVHCETQEQWDFITEKLNYDWSKVNKCARWDTMKDNSVICLNKLYYCNTVSTENNYYTFQEWLDLNDYTFSDEEPKPIDKPFEFNKWYKPNNADGLFFIQSENTGYGFRSNYKNCWITNNKDYTWYFKNMIPASSEEVKERLLKYAKEKYPIGTQFKELNTPYSLKDFNEAEFDYYPKDDQLTCGQSIYIKGKWAEAISNPATKESKEMQLFDLKNPIFNIGDKVRVVADSLKEFNSSFTSGNQTDFKKNYEGVITGVGSCKSDFKEVDTWCELDDCSDSISCNLLELVEPAKKEFNRDWYVEVNSQEEADLVFQYLESVGEKLGDAFDKEWTRNWKYVIQNNNKWICDGIKNNKPQKQLSDILPNYSSEPKVNRNVYYEVETQEQYNEILDWLEGRGEKVNKGYGVIDHWKYICFENSEWSLNKRVESQLSKAEFQFKDKPETQPIKTGTGIRDQILQYPYQYGYKTIDSSSAWEALMNPSTQNSRAELKQEPIKLVSFEEDNIVLFKTNSVKISNKQLIIND